MEMAANKPPLTPLEREQIMGKAQEEVEYKVELFSKLTQTCYKKCIEIRYKEAELYIGENSCIDRCVSKYSQVNNIVGQIIASGRPPGTPPNMPPGTPPSTPPDTPPSPPPGTRPGPPPDRPPG